MDHDIGIRIIVRTQYFWRSRRDLPEGGRRPWIRHYLEVLELLQAIKSRS